jgi:hypothetical protein
VILTFLNCSWQFFANCARRELASNLKILKQGHKKGSRAKKILKSPKIAPKNILG